MSRGGARDAADAWGPVLLWAGGIVVVTTIPLPEEAGTGVTHVDKLLHAAMYSGLGWTVARALHRTGRSTGGALLLATLASVGFAGLDEWHQSWVGRDPALGDWAADAVGLVAGLGLFLLLRSGGVGDRAAGTSRGEEHPAAETSRRDGGHEPIRDGRER